MHVNKQQHRATRLLHCTHDAADYDGAVGMPIVTSTAYEQATAEELEAVFTGRAPGYVYARIGNPTVTAFERQATVLEDGLGALACASGMSAVSATLILLAGGEGEIIASPAIFGGTRYLLTRTLPPLGIHTHWVDMQDYAAVEKAITPATRAIFTETIGNPAMTVADLDRLAEIADRYGVALIADNTATPYICRPKDHGAHIIIHSASKFISGHGNAIGGLIVDSGTFDWSPPRYAHMREWVEKFRHFAFLAALRSQVQRDLGGCLSPFNAALLISGMESLPVRMERCCTNAAQLAAWLNERSDVAEVNYPGLPAHPDYAIAEKMTDGKYGALLALRLGTRARCFKFINALKIFRNVANLGDARSLVVHPASTIARELDKESMLSSGIYDDLLRISVGLENVDDLIADCSGALDAAE